MTCTHALMLCIAIACGLSIIAGLVVAYILLTEKVSATKYDLITYGLILGIVIGIASAYIVNALPGGNSHECTTVRVLRMPDSP